MRHLGCAELIHFRDESENDHRRDGSRIQFYTENATVFGQQISMVLTGGKRLLEFRQSRAYLVHNLAGVNAGNRIASVKIGFWPKHTAPTPRATINMVFAAVRSP